MYEEKIRVLKFLSLFAIGGTERQFVNIIQRLDRRHFDLHVACFQKWGPFLPEVEACGWPVRTYQIQGMFSYKTLRRQLQFARYLRQHRIQVVHTYGWYANVFGIPAATLAGVPVVIGSIQDMGAHITRSKLKVQRAVCRMTTCVLVNSETIRDWLICEGYPENKIQVIRNGIVTDVEKLRGPQTLRKEFCIGSADPIVGMVCRINPVKAVGDFLKAATLVLRQLPQVRFLIVGDGEERGSLAEQAHQLGIEDHVVFTGFRTDTAQILPQ